MDRDELIRRHLGLPGRLAREHRGRGVPVEDLEGEANVALCRAAREYDVETHPDVSFAAFACRYINQALKEAIERCDAVTIPRALKRAVIRCRAASDALFALGVLRPSAEQIAAAADLDLGTCLEALRVAESEVPIDLFAEEAEDPEQVRKLELVEEVLDRCSELGRRVLTLVRVDGLTMGQAAMATGRPMAEVRRAHHEASLCVAEAMRRRGWSEATWAAAIA